MAKADVVITLKPTLMDAQGATIRAALQNLGYHRVSDVRIGKIIEIDLEDEGTDAEALRSEVEKMCDQLLANPVIEDYRVEIH